jgi:hypothetical protein
MNIASPSPKKNLVMPVAPMFETIMATRANSLLKRLCRVKNIQGHTEEWINTVKETNWNQGSGNENLEERSLNIGTIGMVVGVANPKTVLRLLVITKDGNQDVDGIYHMNVLNLEPYNEKEKP